MKIEKRPSYQKHSFSDRFSATRKNISKRTFVTRGHSVTANATEKPPSFNAGCERQWRITSEQAMEFTAHQTWKKRFNFL